MGLDSHLRYKTKPAQKLRKISRDNHKRIGLRLIYPFKQPTSPPIRDTHSDMRHTAVDIPRKRQRAHRKTCGTRSSHLERPDKEIQKFTIAQEGPAQVVHVDHVIEKFRSKNVRYKPPSQTEETGPPVRGR